MEDLHGGVFRALSPARDVVAVVLVKNRLIGVRLDTLNGLQSLSEYSAVIRSSRGSKREKQGGGCEGRVPLCIPVSGDAKAGVASHNARYGEFRRVVQTVRETVASGSFVGELVVVRDFGEIDAKLGKALDIVEKDSFKRFPRRQQM